MQEKKETYGKINSLSPGDWESEFLAAKESCGSVLYKSPGSITNILRESEKLHRQCWRRGGGGIRGLFTRRTEGRPPHSPSLRTAAVYYIMPGGGGGGGTAAGINTHNHVAWNTHLKGQLGRQGGMVQRYCRHRGRP
jgi:hypothetical protein